MCESFKCSGEFECDLSLFVMRVLLPYRSFAAAIALAQQAVLVRNKVAEKGGRKLRLLCSALIFEIDDGFSKCI